MRVAGGIEDVEDGWRGEVCWGEEDGWEQRIMGRDSGGGDALKCMPPAHLSALHYILRNLPLHNSSEKRVNVYFFRFADKMFFNLLNYNIVFVSYLSASNGGE